jgi:hypothetical protein
MLKILAILELIINAVVIFLTQCGNGPVRSQVGPPPGALIAYGRMRSEFP